MAERNLKIKSFPLSNVTSMQSGKEHGNINILVDNETIYEIMAGTPIVFSLVVADSTEFDDVKKELEKGGE